MTTRLAGALTALAAGLTLTACGTTTTAEPDAAAPPCRTASLTWTLTLLDGKGAAHASGTGHDGPPGARLTAVNKGPGTCLFAGYPSLEIHNGKADGVEGAGPGHPAALSLPGKGAVAVDLRYTPPGTKGADTWCVRQGEAAVRAPHDSRGTSVPVTDAHGRSAVLDACGETIAMAAPRRTGAGS
ncbi:hypothetical protein ACF073_06730 [Streptomyces sp. NPDC015171]|uniref:hypothetical protein n=1 Tax=Streptomyces sp. NPDC015171 TaxID=3364945 RepID=UPI0037000802